MLLVIVGGTVSAGYTKIEKNWLALGRVPLAAVITPLNVPDSDGVPEIVPLEVIDKPGGRPVALNVIVESPVAVTT